MPIYTIEKNETGTWEQAVFYDKDMTVVDCTKDREKAISVASKRAEFYKYQTRVLEDFVIIHHYCKVHEEGICDLMNPPEWVVEYRRHLALADQKRYYDSSERLIDFLKGHAQDILGIWAEE